ncbi:MAG: helix-turn-helix domain-containing protein [Pseudomonadota bacterium]
MPVYKIPKIQHLPPKGTPRKRIVFVTNPNSRSLEYFGPLQVFDEARIFFDYEQRLDLAYEIEVVSTEPGQLYERKGFSIQAPIPYHRLRGEVDTLILQAADEGDACLHDQKFLKWVRRMSGRVRRMVSICTGSFILAEAGLLDGKRASTHWCAFDDFREKYPNVTLDPDAIFVKDEHIYTSAGATSGMDLAIALIEEDFGTAFARRVAQGLVMFLRKPAYQSQFSVHVVGETEGADDLKPIISYISENLESDLRIETLASKFHMSQRTFVRLFSHQTGTSPGRYIEQLRIERARQLLEDTNRSVSKIAESCGYNSVDGLRLAFERKLGTSPKQYRDRFTSAIVLNERSGGV